MPKSKRKFHRTVIEIEVLSEEKVDFSGWPLKNIDHEITYGDCSGRVTVKSTEEIDGERMAKLLLNQESDPGFFQLTEEGEDENEVEAV